MFVEADVVVRTDAESPPGAKRKPQERLWSVWRRELQLGLARANPGPGGAIAGKRANLKSQEQ